MRIERIRVVTIRETAERREPYYCDVWDCNQPTKDHKAFCRFHVTQTPYVKSLLKEIKKRDARRKRQLRSKS